MSAQTSPSTGRMYGVERVCLAWDFPRSTYYAQQPQDGQTLTDEARPRRGPAPPVSDDKLLELIRSDLSSSPFKGEGYRKVHARLKRVKGIRVAPKRVLRLMKANKLLSPHRVPRGQKDLHDGTICTTQPDDIWATDGAQILTVDDGKVWLFVGVDHYNAECVGWHVCKRGDRFAALQPIAQGLATYFGGADSGVGRGLTVRMDHGSQYISDHFLNQLRSWGVAPSYAFVGEPQTNGVAERFIRTLKEQCVYGRVFRNLEEVRQAVAGFVKAYNHHWRLGKLNHRTPLEARRDFAATGGTTTLATAA